MEELLRAPKPSILVFCPLYPPSIGGLQSHAHDFNVRLSRQGFSITVFTPSLASTPAERLPSGAGLTILYFPAFEIIPNYPLPKLWQLRWWRLYISLFKKRHDIVLSRTRFFSTSLLALIYRLLTKTPWVHIEHGSDYVRLNRSVLQNVAHLYDHLLGRLIFSLADQVVANSHATARFVQHLVPLRHVVTIYRGVDHAAIHAAQPHPLPDQRFKQHLVVVFTGRLIDGKGIPDLLSALASLRQHRLRLWIVGDGPQRQALANSAAALQVHEQVLFWGARSLTQTIALLKQADIFVNPSYTEGLPTSVIEAALCRKAIVATNVGGTGEIIVNSYSGTLVRAGDPAALAAAIEALAVNPAQRALYGENAYKDVSNRFHWATSIEAYQELFAQTLSKEHGL